MCCTGLYRIALSDSLYDRIRCGLCALGYVHASYFHISQLSGSCLAAFWSAGSLTTLNLEYNRLDESAKAALRAAARPALKLDL